MPKKRSASENDAAVVQKDMAAQAGPDASAEQELKWLKNFFIKIDKCVEPGIPESYRSPKSNYGEHGF